MFTKGFTLVFWLLSSNGNISDKGVGRYSSEQECKAAGETLEFNLHNGMNDKLVWSCTQSPNF